MHNPYCPSNDLDRDLEILAKLRENIANLVNLYLEQQSALLRKSPGAEPVVLIVGLLRTGARLQWGLQGWEIVGSGLPVPLDIIRGLCDTQLIEGADGYAAWSVNALSRQEQDREVDVFEDLLCSRHGADLDHLSAAILRWQQDIALFRRIRHLCAKRRELRDAVHDEPDYWASTRSSIRWWQSVAKLSAAVALNLLPTCQLKLRLARRSLVAMKELLPRLFD